MTGRLLSCFSTGDFAFNGPLPSLHSSRTAVYISDSNGGIKCAVNVSTGNLRMSDDMTGFTGAGMRFIVKQDRIRDKKY